jgi:cyclopropane-fatty-acyl-phospholipid synthase
MNTRPMHDEQSASRQSSPPDNQIGASPEAIGVHYDLSDEFFKLWLGPEMIYSCAMFDESQDLASAQMRKLDYHIEAAAAAGAPRVLDIGCGWGGLLERLVVHAGVKNAIGLTISSSQANWVRRTARPGIEVREEHWRDHRPDKPYDAIISIGAFEHFVHPGMDSAKKLDCYREFFRWCDGALAPGGRLSLQTIAYTAPPSEVDRKRMAFIGERIFPESELPLIWEPIAAAEGRFELVTLRNDREHYYQTLRHWEHNLVTRHNEAVAQVGEAAVADFRRYLRESSWGFKLGVVCLLRMCFVKVA